MTSKPVTSTTINSGFSIPGDPRSTDQDGPGDDQTPLVSIFLDQDIYQDLLGDFVIGLRQDLRSLDEAITTQNSASISRIAHKVRGTAATFGYPDFAAVAEKMELAAQGIQKSTSGSYNILLFKVLLKSMARLHHRMLLGLRNY